MEPTIAPGGSGAGPHRPSCAGGDALEVCYLCVVLGFRGQRAANKTDSNNGCKVARRRLGKVRAVSSGVTPPISILLPRCRRCGGEIVSDAWPSPPGFPC